MDFFSNFYKFFVFLFQMDKPWREPALENGWCLSGLGITDLSTALATVVIAIFSVLTVCVQIRQHEHQKQVANANYQHSLHKDRLQVYYAFRDFHDYLMVNGNPERLAVHEFMAKVRDAKFLFDEDVLQKIDELLDHARQYFRLETRIEALRQIDRRRALTAAENEQWNDLFQKLEELETSIFDEMYGKQLDDLFERYLKLPKSL